MALNERLRREFDSVGFFCLAIRSTPMPRFSRGCGCSPGPCSSARSSRAPLPDGLLPRCSTVTKGEPSRARRWDRPALGSVRQYEAILFQEGLNQYRDHLEKGASVLVGLQAAIEARMWRPHRFRGAFGCGR